METKSDKSIAALVLGIIGLIACIIPIIGMPITIVGLVLGIKSRNSKNRGLAIAGIVLCIIGLLVTVINASIGVYKGATGEFPSYNSTSSNIPIDDVEFCIGVDNNLNPIGISETFSAGQVYARLETEDPFKTTKIKVTIYKQKNGTESVLDSSEQEVNQDWNTIAIPVSFDIPGKYKVAFTNLSNDKKLGEGQVTIQ